MKLRNKKTGEIRDFNTVIHELNMFNSITELNEEWEDYKENELYFCITGFDDGVTAIRNHNEPINQFVISIGNYFKTKEEAEKAVEKLKAWKRLKDAGLYFVYDAIKEGSKHKFILRLECEDAKRMTIKAECKSLYKDLKFLFGGEE